MKKFLISSSVSCRERMFDCQKIFNYLIINGWHPIKDVSKTDLIIINTCSFNKEEDDSSVDLINYYLKKKPKSAQMIIAGCMPVINPDRLSGIADFPTVSPTNLDKLNDMIKANVKLCDIKEPNFISLSEVSYRPLLKKVLFGKSLLIKFFDNFEIKRNSLRKCTKFVRNTVTYANSIKSYINPFLVCNVNKFYYLRISKGCLGNCSYCAKKFATGTLKSKLINEISNEFANGLTERYKDFFLLSEDTGCYGIDIGTTVVSLLKEIFQIGRGYDFRLVITNFNAQWFVKYFRELEEIILHNHNKILYLQIPIQSGSNRILRLMNRPYNIEEVKVLLHRLKERAPLLNITTDIIVGFPGETEEDFNMTKELMNGVKLNYTDVFCYADRPNTLASKIINKISQETIEKRKFELLRIQNLRIRADVCLKKFVELTKKFA